MKPSFVLLLLLLCAVLPARAAVYAAGLVQARLTTGRVDRETPIATDPTRTFAAGTVMANTNNGGKDWNGTDWSWGDNMSFAYAGEMWMEEGTNYVFGKWVSGWSYLVVGGTVVIDNGVWNEFVASNYVAAATGWTPIEIRFGHGTGGAGLNSGGIFGCGYNIKGRMDYDYFSKGWGGWRALLDPGDGSVLRAKYSDADLMTVKRLSKDGEDVLVTASFAGLAKAGTLSAFYGADDGGSRSNAWEACAAIATIPAGDTAEAQYRVPDVGRAKVIAFRLATTMQTAVPVQQWSETFPVAPRPTVVVVK